MNGLINLELFRCFYLEYPKRLPWVNSDALRRNSGASLDALDIFHAVRGKSVWTGNSETLSRKSGGADDKPTIRNFRIVALEAALGLISYLPRRIFT
jgi:hypothetical protein